MSLRVEIDDDLVDCLSSFMEDEKLSDLDEAVNEALADYFSGDVDEDEEPVIRNRNRR